MDKDIEKLGKLLDKKNKEIKALRAVLREAGIGQWRANLLYARHYLKKRGD